MQDSYLGDIGDMAKLGLLRALSEGKRQLGVAWYLYPHEDVKAVGIHDSVHQEAQDFPQKVLISVPPALVINDNKGAC